MPAKPKSEADHIIETRKAVIAAALPHVVFDGWSAATLAEAVADSGVDAGLAALAFPRGAVDLALAFHFAGDAEMRAQMAQAEFGALRYRDRVARAIAIRLQIAAPHKEAVRRGMALFALGDEDGSETPAFIDRRIEDVMRFEKAKAAFRNSGMGKLWAAGPGKILGQVQAPSPQTDMPGYTGPTHANTET